MTTKSGVELIIKLGDGEDPEVFSEPCGLKVRGFSREAASNTSEGYDCANPDNPGWTEELIQSFSSNINGSGKMHIESIAAWDTFFTGGVSVNLQIVVPGLGTFEGKFVCTSLNLSGEKGDKIEVDVSLKSDGVIALNS